VVVWRVESGAHLRPSQAHSNLSDSVDLSPNGSALARRLRAGTAALNGIPGPDSRCIHPGELLA
jgi:hypothetical protein